MYGLLAHNLLIWGYLGSLEKVPSLSVCVHALRMTAEWRRSRDWAKKDTLVKPLLEVTLQKLVDKRE